MQCDHLWCYNFYCNNMHCYCKVHFFFLCCKLQIPVRYTKYYYKKQYDSYNIIQLNVIYSLNKFYIRTLNDKSN